MSLFSAYFSAGVSQWPRRVLVLGLLVLLLLIGVYDVLLLAALSKSWALLLNALHLNGAAASLRPITNQPGPHWPSLPGVSYIGLYLSICLLLLRLLLPAQWRAAYRIYGGVALAYAVLLLGSKMAGWQWAYKLSQDLLHFLVSPLPVLALVALLRGSRQIFPSRKTDRD